MVKARMPLQRTWVSSFRPYRDVIKCLLVLSATSVVETTTLTTTTTITSSTTTRPNFIVFLADNLGYSDLSCLGGPPGRTPNIDRLRSEGIQFNHWNSAAHLCSASRATLLTGKYAVKTGIYPSVFHNDAVFGLMPYEMTLPKYLKQEGYATSIVGKYHLGHRDPYLPTKQGFDEWLGIPYHMSGGSLDGHICSYDSDESWWLPLYENETIIEQPVNLKSLAQQYSKRASKFIKTNVKNGKPFFLYVAFSHVHQLCAPKDGNEQEKCQWAEGLSKTFGDAVHEMDWITGQVMKTLNESGADNNTMVLFTSDNGPWLAEQKCSGSKGPYEGRWLADNVSQNCTACPHEYLPSPMPDRPRRCKLKEGEIFLDGVHCGEDVGLGSVWEANLRMPAFARFVGHIRANTTTDAAVSTLDVFPTFLSFLNAPLPSELDGVDITPVLLEEEYDYGSENRVLFFWRDGYSEGPLPAPYGRHDVAAVKVGHIKAWFWTKSAHYNDDPAVFHDPPLMFDIQADPAESQPLDPKNHQDLINKIQKLVQKHKESISWATPLTLATDARYRPCANASNSCRTDVIQHKMAESE